MKDLHFLAVCKDRPNDPDGFWYTVYYVNNSPADIEEGSYETFGYATFDDELIQTNTHRRKLGKIPAYSFVEIETDDEGSFDFVISFTFDLKVNNKKTVTESYSIGKYLSGGKKPLEKLPVLNKHGQVFVNK